MVFDGGEEWRDENTGLPIPHVIGWAPEYTPVVEWIEKEPKLRFHRYPESEPELIGWRGTDLADSSTVVVYDGTSFFEAHLIVIDSIKIWVNVENGVVLYGIIGWSSDVESWKDDQPIIEWIENS